MMLMYYEKLHPSEYDSDFPTSLGTVNIGRIVNFYFENVTTFCSKQTTFSNASFLHVILLYHSLCNPFLKVLSFAESRVSHLFQFEHDKKR